MIMDSGKQLEVNAYKWQETFIGNKCRKWIKDGKEKREFPGINK